MATNKKPTHTLRCGNIKATIWQNVSEKGPFFATTFSRPFKDHFGARGKPQRSWYSRLVEFGPWWMKFYDQGHSNYPRGVLFAICRGLILPMH